MSGYGVDPGDLTRHAHATLELLAPLRAALASGDLDPATLAALRGLTELGEGLSTLVDASALAYARCETEGTWA
ncbi:hypothetical protein Afil01_15960 [Actinorhabdospora filicis]|uniref:Uncharacterized protein n=1 Tax=Actinorhabdospora filicis TaxID=1785913 RepID=A0A9W6W7Q0_9ACTN|nr:hypothetical protein [Actinorhabdospora filicis]GLZ76789.1 hypothetical protein Afil01_15960 [Actinorhabdospora filicis]